MLSVTAVMVLLCLIVNAANFISTDSGLKEMLDFLCENQGKMPHMRPGERPGGKPDGFFTKETPYSTRYFMLIYDSDGNLIKANLENIAAVTDEDTDKFLYIAERHGEGYGFLSDYKYRVVTISENRYMAVFLDCYRELRSVTTTLYISIAAAAVCIALVYVAVVLFSRRAVDPVVRASERQKQFITDASHELKTPITVIATCLRVLEMETGNQKWIDKAKAQTEKLRDLVNSLVTLSRMDEENSPMKSEPFPISEALIETVESFRELAAERGHELNAEIEPNIVYCGDEYAVRQLVSILMDNAVKYAANGSPISISLDRTRRGVVIRESNACEPNGCEPNSFEAISKEELSKLFDRFYRIDSSRSSDGGFGIGLSIARSIAEGHRGSITASMDGGNIVFTAELR